MQRGDIVAGKYRLNLLLGSGGMAEVWSATNTFTERQVAIKFMNAQVAKTPEAAARFLKEAKVSARVNHPNIIDVLDVGQTDENRLFLVMELLAGYPLETALRRQTPPMTVYEFSLVMIEVAEALAAAHRAGIVHRDLKPTNIYLHKVKNGTAVPKLLDFGVSKFLDDDTNNALTIAGTVLGSPLYMSPEQARGEVAIDGRTDIFAFGTILFEALSGYRPYEGKNFNALIVAIATTKPIAIDEAAPHLPESLRRVVRTCMETNPKRRAQKFEDVIAMMRDALPELEASLDRLPPTHVVSPAEDPEATNPIPMLHRSDRPAHNAASSTGETASVTRSATIPPNAVSTKAGDGSGTFPPPGGTTVTKRYPAWLIGFGATLAIGVVGIGVLIFVRSPSEGARSTAVFPPERRYPEASA
ncbi:MAG TPA: serine/threonine-protein kinase, partial [Labilithrix sp.]|nr:serine/threonine-protein kinase [Labilithrix sp.]